MANINEKGNAMSIDLAVTRAFEKKRKNGWDKWPKFYWAIDLHDVIIPGTYTRNNEGRQFYPDAEEVLKWLTKRNDMTLILYTSSWENSIEDIREWMLNRTIRFDYVNANPECDSNDLCCFNVKFFFDVMLEDKAGFEGSVDWTEIKKTLIKLGEWQKPNSHND